MNELMNYRKDLHQIPELGFAEHLTQAYLLKELSKIGYEGTKICETGIYVYIDLNKPETIAFRSDIDGLPILEESDCEYKSTHIGKMHACGHDGHMAILLGFAKHLKTSDLSNLKYNLMLLFQPAEEGPGGAKKIIETGIFKHLKVKAIFGLHLFPDIEEGKIACKSGPIMASSCEIDIDFNGKSTHVGMPHLGINAITLGAQFLSDVEKEVKAKITDPYIIGFGKFSGGTVRNIISGHSSAEGTIRAFDKKTNDAILSIFEQLKKEYATKFNLQVELQARYLYYPTINDDNLHSEFVKLFSTEKNYLALSKPYLTAEDFSFYQQALPGLYFLVGCRNEKENCIYPLHNSKFNFTAKALEVGLNTYIKILNSYRGN